MKRVITVMALGAVLAGCSGVTHQEAPDSACEAAFEAAEEIISAQGEVSNAMADLVGEIYPAIEGVLVFDVDALTGLLDSVDNATKVTRGATNTIKKSDYKELKGACLG